MRPDDGDSVSDGKVCLKGSQAVMPLSYCTPCMIFSRILDQWMCFTDCQGEFIGRQQSVQEQFPETAALAQSPSIILHVAQQQSSASIQSLSMLQFTNSVVPFERMVGELYGCDQVFRKIRDSEVTFC
jgi:hypothetical protein